MEKEKLFKVFMVVNLYIVTPKKQNEEQRKTLKKPSPFPQLLVLYLLGFPSLTKQTSLVKTPPCELS
jgi:hypothetical protein